jgi:aspartyl/glutamyl-tRNA(Asn/Gln) amidotransferase C subunit
MTKRSDDIRAVYELAALAADEAEITAMNGHFEKMFKHLEDLARVPVDGVEPYFVLPLRELPLMADTATASGVEAAIRGTFVQNAEEFLVVQRVVNRGAGECAGEEE